MSKYGTLETEIKGTEASDRRPCGDGLPAGGSSCRARRWLGTRVSSDRRERTSSSAGTSLDSASNDIGFARTADGRYVAQLSEYDQAIGFDQKWLNRVHQLYKEKQTISFRQGEGLYLQGPGSG